MDAGDVHDEGELVDEFVILLSGRVFACFGGEATEQIDHAACYVWADPDVAIDYPDDVAFGFAVGSAHVANLGVWTQIGRMSMLTSQVRIFVLHQNTCIMLIILSEQMFKRLEDRIISAWDA